MSKIFTETQYKEYCNFINLINETEDAQPCIDLGKWIRNNKITTSIIEALDKRMNKECSERMDLINV
jgi:hypothetical protein